MGFRIYVSLFLGLRFCVLKKDVPTAERRPDTSSTFLPTVPSPKQPEFNPAAFDSSPATESLIPLVRNGHIEEAKALIEDGADVNEEDQHGN